MEIIPNTYKDLTAICDTCGLPIRNSTSSWAKRCIEPGRTKKRSTCQIAKDRETARLHRVKMKEDKNYADHSKHKPEQDQSQVEIRLCIGRLCIEQAEISGTDKSREFESLSPGNRQCEKCQVAGEGLSTKGLGRLGAGMKLEGVSFGG